MTRMRDRHARHIVLDLADRIPVLWVLGLAACTLVCLLPVLAQSTNPQESGKTQQSGDPQQPTKFQQI